MGKVPCTSPKVFASVCIHKQSSYKLLNLLSTIIIIIILNNTPTYIFVGVQVLRGTMLAS